MMHGIKRLGVLLLFAPLPVMAQEPNTLHPEGPFTEPMTGMVFPVAINDFQRVNIVKYAAGGSDESGGYNRVVPDGEIIATVYFFRSPSLVSIGSPQDVVDDARPRLCQSQFHGVEQEVIAAHPDAQRLSEEPVLLEQQGVTHRGFRVRYTLLNRNSLAAARWRSPTPICSVLRMENGPWNTVSTIPWDTMPAHQSQISCAI